MVKFVIILFHINKMYYVFYLQNTARWSVSVSIFSIANNWYSREMVVNKWIFIYHIYILYVINILLSHSAVAHRMPPQAFSIVCIFIVFGIRFSTRIFHFLHCIRIFLFETLFSRWPTRPACVPTKLSMLIDCSSKCVARGYFTALDGLQCPMFSHCLVMRRRSSAKHVLSKNIWIWIWCDSYSLSRPH